MKNSLTILIPVLFVAGTFTAMGLTSNEQEKALRKSDQVFLRRAADARMMDWAEGKAATEKSSDPEIKGYGQSMINDQDALMNELKALAASKNLILPQALSEKKAHGLDDLKEEHGADFDMKFIKMMIIDHKRDVKEFTRATKSEDADVRAFAVKYLPLMEKHLTEAKALKKKLKD